MKKLLLLTAIALLSLSCSKEENTKTQCTCDLKITNSSNGQYYYINNVPNDCNGNFQSVNIKDNEFISGTKDCK